MKRVKVYQTLCATIEISDAAYEGARYDDPEDPGHDKLNTDFMIGYIDAKNAWPNLFDMEEVEEELDFVALDE